MNREDYIDQRAEYCVCKYCGHTLTKKFVIFNKYGGQGVELYCEKCQRIEYGVRPDIYEAAESYVGDFGFNYYLDMEEDKQSFQLNVAKICEIVSWWESHRS